MPGISPRVDESDPAYRKSIEEQEKDFRLLAQGPPSTCCKLTGWMRYAEAAGTRIVLTRLTEVSGNQGQKADHKRQAGQPRFNHSASCGKGANFLKKIATSLALALSVSFTFGLDGLAAEQASSKPAAKSAAKHPWASFSPGAWVKIKSFTVADNAAGKETNIVETKITLLEKTEEKAVLETAMTVRGQTTTTKADLPLKGYTDTLPDGLSISKTGRETITIAARPVVCETMEATMDLHGSKIAFQRWISEQVPGSLVKMVTLSEGSRSTAQVVDFNAP